MDRFTCDCDCHFVYNTIFVYSVFWRYFSRIYLHWCRRELMNGMPYFIGHLWFALRFAGVIFFAPVILKSTYGIGDLHDRREIQQQIGANVVARCESSNVRMLCVCWYVLFSAPFWMAQMWIGADPSAAHLERAHLPLQSGSRQFHSLVSCSIRI